MGRSYGGSKPYGIKPASRRRDVNYYEYIKSDDWKAVRKRYMKSKLPKICAGCGKEWKPWDHLHHRTYKNLGNERLMDLIALCQPCHSYVHQYHRNHPSLHIWFATKKALAQLRKRRKQDDQLLLGR